LAHLSETLGQFQGGVTLVERAIHGASAALDGRRSSVVGDPASIPQLVTLPSGSFTSI